MPYNRHGALIQIESLKVITVCLFVGNDPFRAHFHTGVVTQALMRLKVDTPEMFVTNKRYTLAGKIIGKAQ